MTSRPFKFIVFGIIALLAAFSAALIRAGWFSSKAATVDVASAPAVSAVVPDGSVQTLILLPNLAGDPKALLAFLNKHSDFKATLLFPPAYFDGADRRALVKEFQTLQSSGQIEVALTLDNQPMLPLLADFSGVTGSRWNLSFEWPADVATQIARGSAAYQRRWASLPSGFIPPYFALSEAVLDNIKRFRMAWTLSAAAATPGVRFYGSLGVLTPPQTPVWEGKDTKAWANDAAEWSLLQHIIYIDMSKQTDVQSEIKYLEAFVKKRQNSAMQLVTAQQFVTTTPESQTLPKDNTLFNNDYSGWAASPQQKKAWIALADAHKALDAYQSSGHANLQRLDAAVEEMSNAQSGPFLFDLGGSAPLDAERERSFSATLANVYRLTDNPVPATLNSWFGSRTWQKSAPSNKASAQDGPFFKAMSQNYTWNDPKGDDNGGGSYIYPVGAYPKGMFDLKTVNVQWDETTVTLSVSVVEDFSRKTLPIIPLADFYIDVNRLTDAGNTTALTRRGDLTMERDAAWEYAVSLSPQRAVLYQAIPGADPRTMDSSNKVTNNGRSWSATFSRSKLRGDPKRWRLSVALMGTDNSPQAVDPAPVTFRQTATERNFGGATKSRVAPVIDFLAPTVEEQNTAVGINGNGGPLTLPYVEGQ